MCLTLAAQPLPSQTPAASAPHSDHSPHTGHAKLVQEPRDALNGDERILHALNRFTFGPRAGDLETVRAIGLDEWFEQQLRPAGMEYADLNRRLDEMPSMRLSTPQLLVAFPSGEIIRQTANGKLAMPNTPILRAVYNDQITFYQEREARKAEKKAESGQGTVPGKETVQPAMAATPGGSMNGAANDTMAGSTESRAAGRTASMFGSAMNSDERTPPIDPGGTKPAKVQAARPSPADAELLTILALPPEQRVKRLLAMSPSELEDFRAGLKGPQRAQLLGRMSAGQREIVADLENPTRAVVDEMMQQRLIRDVYSPAQLQEVMTDFWLNHFNVYLHKNEATPYYLVSYERDVIRPRALGRFEDLLVATAENPAMLLYLDNSSSMGPDSAAAEKEKQRSAGQNKPAPPPGLNENYARELMELHTLGVNGGYTQRDVTEMARVFTGWTVDQPARGGGFLFDERKHEPGTKKLLGMKVKDGGQKEGLEMLHVLATRPATGHFLSRKLAMRFVADDPPESLVDRMAKSYLASGGDIATVLRTMFHSPEFWQRDVYRAKVKTPLEYVVSAVRASNSETGSMMPLVRAIDRMGMPLYGCVPPTGYASKAEDWVSSGALVNRMNFALALAANKLAEIHSDWPLSSNEGELAREVAGDAAPVDLTADEQRLENQLVEGGVSEHTREAVLEHVKNPSGVPTGNAGAEGPPAKPVNTAAQIVGNQKRPTPLATKAATPAAREKMDALLAGLLLGSPEFQRR
jgi:uncharacterized protein (DUF1800 family)